MSNEKAREDTKQTVEEVAILEIEHKSKSHLPRLLFLSQEFRKKSISLGPEFEDDITIGRSDDTDFPIHEQTISGLHCKIQKLTDHLYSISDCNSTNGTFVNGIRLIPGEPQNFSHGDVLKIGAVELVYLDEETRSIHSDTKPVVNIEDSNKNNMEDIKNMSPYYHPRENKNVVIIINSIIGILIAVAIFAVGWFVTLLLGF